MASRRWIDNLIGIRTVWGDRSLPDRTLASCPARGQHARTLQCSIFDRRRVCRWRM